MGFEPLNLLVSLHLHFILSSTCATCQQLLQIKHFPRPMHVLDFNSFSMHRDMLQSVFITCVWHTVTPALQHNGNILQCAHH